MTFVKRVWMGWLFQEEPTFNGDKLGYWDKCGYCRPGCCHWSWVRARRSVVQSS